MAKASRYRWQNLRGYGQPAPVQRKQGAPQPKLRGKPTKPQLDYIAALAKRLGEPAPKVHTRAEASVVIAHLKAQQPPPEKPEGPEFV
jgi:hypothetical protein